MFSNWSWRWIIFVSAVAAQNNKDITTTLSASPSNNVLAGTTVNLTCKFELGKDNLRYLRFTGEKGVELFEFNPTQPSGPNYGSTLSDSPGGESQVWRTVEATFCGTSSLVTYYGCTPVNNLIQFGSSNMSVTLAGPKEEVSIGGKSCAGGSLSLGSEVVNVPQKINVSVSNERNPVTNLTLKINNDKVMGSPVVKDNTDVCAYAAEKTTDHTFTKSDVFSLVYSYSSAGNKIEKTCTVTVNEPTTTVATTETTTAPGGSGGLGGGAIAGIIIFVIIVVVVICGVVWYRFCEGRAYVAALVKSRDKRPKPEDGELLEKIDVDWELAGKKIEEFAGTPWGAFIKNRIDDNPVIMFGETTSPDCEVVKKVLDETKVAYKVENIDQRDDNDKLLDLFKELTGKRAVPVVFIGGKCIGGKIEVMKLRDQERLIPLMEKANATYRLQV